jgi:hypothetical protein
MGGILSRRCRGSTGVVLKHPLIFQQVSFWATYRMLISSFWFLSVNQADELYVRMGRMIAWYTLHQLA